MKRILSFLLLLPLLIGCGDPVKPDPTPAPDPEPVKYDGGSGSTYQLLVYSFCDSDGDGIGDFNGIASKLDYLKEMGVQALWFSPIHPASSYHGYDVTDYERVNPEYGTEADFKSLLDKAHAKGIKIYLDYVLNHTSKDHPWFIDAKSGNDSPYRSFYFFSTTQKAGYYQAVASDSPGKVNVKFTLKCDGSGTPLTIKAEQVETITNSGTPTSGKYLWYGSVTDSTMPQFYSNGSDTYTLSLALETDWGVLVRTSKSEWGSAKYGAASESANTLAWGKELKLKSGSDYDILMPWMNNIYYQSFFGNGYMPDLNYGPASSCETSAAFKAVCEAADKWIRMGVDGFRLDAIKHIYDNDKSDENPTFLKKFYDHCNATYKACGGSGDIYMVGEQFSEANEVAPYYKGLPAFFEFSFWWRVKDAINGGRADNLVATLQSYQKLYAAQRKDFINATKLSNHDEDRAGNDLGRSSQKMKLAGAVLLTAGGQPYIYQGEELGYWGSKAGGDEYVRTPMMWRADGSGMASAKIRVDKAMLTPSISVESQEKDDASVLAVYKTFGSLRGEYKALAIGSFDYCASVSAAQSVSAWYRTTDDQQVLVMHNFAASPANVSVSGDDLSALIGSNGSVKVSGQSVNLGGYASAVFLVK